MRKRKKIKLSYSKERVLFSDVLPYECPIIFSNRYLYRFFAKYLWIGEEQKVDNIMWNVLKQSKRLDEKDANAFAALLFGCYEKGKRIGILQHRLNDLFYPYQFNIAHKANKNRTLSIIHPYNQWKVVEFYEQYKYSILYLCNQSKYSLRKPHKIAQYFYYRDRLHQKLSGHESDKVELFFNEYENLKTYFSYEKYSNIYKFYEDYRYQRAEKKFKYLVKFDLQSCFDSIYTHTISWATAGGADKVKVLPGYHGSWVGDAFDNLMQSVNARETNGIVIGPEFSRIFAEIILQYIDQKVEQELWKEKKLRHKSTYECYRYVDDYFLFYNDEKDRNLFMESLTKWLKEFKLQISPSKTEEFERPFITQVTIAKQRIENLLSDIFSTPLWEDIETKLNSEEEEDTEDENSDKDRIILDKRFNNYKTNFVPREPNNRNKRALVAAATDLLCVKNDVYQEQACFGGRKLKPTAARYFDDGKTQMLIIYNELAVDAFVKVIDGIEVAGRIKVYVFSNNRYAYNDNFEPVAEKVEVCALPAAIYDAYKQVLKPRKRNDMTSADAPFAEETSIETEQGTLNFKEEGGEA